MPDAVRAALPALPELMAESDRRARAAERACADATEAAVLQGRVGEDFRAVVVDHTEKGMTVQLVEVPVLARVSGERAALGDEILARLEAPTCGPASSSSCGPDGRPAAGGREPASRTPTLARGRVGRTVASVGNHRRGRSGLRRAGWWPTATRGDPRDSATENRPPRSRERAGQG